MTRDAANLEFHATRGASLSPRLSVWLCAWLLLFLSAPPGFADERVSLVRYEATAHLMGCTFGVSAYGADRDTLHRHVESAFEEARIIDGWLSNYRDDSELSRLNRSAAERPVLVSGELFALLAKALEYARLSEGGFDMTVGPLVRAWGFYDGGGRLPDQHELAQARESVGYRLVELDPAAKTVHFARAGAELDPGSIGKGYAVYRMVEILRSAGIQSALLNACHSSIYALGAPPDNPRGWRVEIDSPGGANEEVFLNNQSLSTSGSQEKFFEADGRRYSHILDPRTGYPADGLIAVSVVADTALESEVWSTAIFVNGLEWASGKAPPSLDVYGCRAGDPCVWIRRRF